MTEKEKIYQEAELIRGSYMRTAGGKTGIDTLREMDRAAKRPGSIAAFTIGIIGALVLGFGMCLSMLTSSYFVPGILVGIIGIGLVTLPYFVYKSMTKKRMNAIADQMIRISDAIMQGQ